MKKERKKEETKKEKNEGMDGTKEGRKNDERK